MAGPCLSIHCPWDNIITPFYASLKTSYNLVFLEVYFKHPAGVTVCLGIFVWAYFSLRSTRFEVVGAKKNGCARRRHACLPLAHPFFLAPTTSIQALATQTRLPPPQALRFSHRRGERETRVTGDEPQGTMGRVQTAGEAPARSCVVFLAKKSFSWHGPIFGLFKSWKRSILVAYCCKHCKL